MINTPYTYVEAGIKCGRARGIGDEQTAVTEERWFGKAVKLESEKDRKRATVLFNAGYNDGVSRP